MARKSFLLRIDPAILDAVERWARDELRSTNGHVEYILRQALHRAGRLGHGVDPVPPDSPERYSP